MSAVITFPRERTSRCSGLWRFDLPQLSLSEVVGELVVTLTGRVGGFTACARGNAVEVAVLRAHVTAMPVESGLTSIADVQWFDGRSCARVVRSVQGPETARGLHARDAERHDRSTARLDEVLGGSPWGW